MEDRKQKAESRTEIKIVAKLFMMNCLRPYEAGGGLGDGTGVSRNSEEKKILMALARREFG